MGDEVVSLYHPDRMDEATFLAHVLKLLEVEQYRRVPVVRTLHLDIVLVDVRAWPHG